MRTRCAAVCRPRCGESINATRIELRTLRQQGLGELGSDGFFEWVKERVHLFRGAVIGTLLRNDALSFIGIGTLIERAFATTQLLLIKDQQLTNDPDPVREYYRLDTLLNAVSAREAYQQPLSPASQSRNGDGAADPA